MKSNLHYCAFTGLFICLVIAVFTGGFYYDGGSDVYTERLISGYITGTPEYFIHTFGFHLFTGSLLQFLYASVSSTFSWYDCWSLLLICFAFLLGAYWLVGKTASSISPWLVVLVYSLLMYENIKYLELSKTAFFLSFFALLLLFAETKRQSVWVKILLIILFILGLCTRCESGYLAVFAAFMVCLVFQFPFTVQSIKAVLPTGVVTLLILLFFAFWLNHAATPADEAYLKLRPYQFTLWDFTQAPGSYCPRSTSDSIILAAAQHHFMADAVHLNAETFHQLCVVPKDKTVSQLLNYFDHSAVLKQKTAAASSYFLKHYWYQFAAALFLFLLTLFVFSKQRKLWGSLFILFSLFSVLLFALAVFMKVEDHVMLPLLTVLLLCFFYLILHLNTNTFLGYSTAFILLIVGLLSIKDVSKKVAFRKVEQRQITELYATLQHLPDSSIVCFDLYMLVKTHIHLFEQSALPPTVIPYSYDNGFMFLTPSWKSKTKTLFGVDNVANLFARKFEAIHYPVYFVFEENRNQLFETYSTIVCKQPITFRQLISPQTPAILPYHIYQKGL